jgi:hypothetical protein
MLLIFPLKDVTTLISIPHWILSRLSQEKGVINLQRSLIPNPFCVGVLVMKETTPLS